MDTETFFGEGGLEALARTPARRAPELFASASMALSGDRAKLYDEEAKRKSGISTSADAAAAWSAVRGAATGAAWLVARLDATGKTLELVAHGYEGGLTALRGHLADDAVSWCAFAFAPGYPYGEGSIKFAFLTCVGSAVSAMKRGKVALQKAGCQVALEGTSAEAGVFQGSSEVTDAAVLAELRRNMPKCELFA